MASKQIKLHDGVVVHPLYIKQLYREPKVFHCSIWSNLVRLPWWQILSFRAVEVLVVVVLVDVVVEVLVVV